MEHGDDAGKCARPGIVDRDDPGVGVRAVEDLGVQHAAHLEVVDEGRVALGQLEGVDLVLGPAHHPCVRHLGMGDHLGSHRVDSLEVGHPRLHVEGDRRHQGGLHRTRGFASQPGCGAPDRQHRTLVARLAVEDPCQCVTDLVLGGIVGAVEQFLGGQHHGRGRVAGLDGTRLHEGLLDRMQLHPTRQTLDGLDLVSLGLGGEHDLARHQPAVDEHGGGTGLAGIGAEAHAVEAGATQHGHQGVVGPARDLEGVPVDAEGEVHDASRIRITRPASSPAR